MPNADVRLDRVTKRFGDFTAVDDLSLAIEHGEFFSLLGPSGCGKTTTLRMIGGFEEVTSGAIHIGETEVTDLPPFQRRVNTVFQNYALFPHLDVFENIAFGLRRRKTPSGEIRSMVASMLDLVDLAGYEKRKPNQLSGGQQQRIALARALVNNPDVLLLDEPLGALDLKLRKQMQVELKRIQDEVGITFVFVTHDQEEAMTMSDRIAVMRQGRIEQLGQPEELYERPRTEFVAGFLGVSNLLDGDAVGRTGEDVDIRLGDGAVVRVPAASVNGSRHVRVGIRPEKLRVTARGGEPSPDGGLNALDGTVLDASYIGVHTQYLVETADGHKITVYAQNLETSGASEALGDGEAVRLTWKPQHTFVIDRVVDGTSETHLEEDPTS
ncbi:ABC transporter ATP-binding protein [Microbacterium sp.]|uniref:ABC transporter ATP-binding protein n=1 Tax=Microbacterium sp. TaxID=51671 RepID=UPI0031FED19F|nr:ABC transporter ATP-binding protein [Microbacterium sp.]